MDMINWIYDLAEGAFRLQIMLNPSFNVSYDPNIPKTGTFAAVLLSGLVGALIMAYIFRPLRLGIIGNTLFGLAGGCIGAYYFLAAIYNIMPNETSMIDFENNVNFDFLTGILIGGLLGGFLLTFLLGLLKNMVFSSRAEA